MHARAVAHALADLDRPAASCPPCYGLAPAMAQCERSGMLLQQAGNSHKYQTHAGSMLGVRVPDLPVRLKQSACAGGHIYSDASNLLIRRHRYHTQLANTAEAVLVPHPSLASLIAAQNCCMPNVGCKRSSMPLSPAIIQQRPRASLHTRPRISPAPSEPFQCSFSTP